MRFVIAISVLACLLAAGGEKQAGTSARFEVTVNAKLASQARNGRLFVIISSRDSGEPRLVAGATGMNSPRMFARDVPTITPSQAATIDETCVAFPYASLRELEPGSYSVQAVYDINLEIKGLNSPGNLYSRPRQIQITSTKGAAIQLELTEQVPPEELPKNTENLKYIKFESRLLSQFWGRPTYLRAGIILPPKHARETSRYPLRVHIGGYGSRYTGIGRMMAEGSEFRRLWQAQDTPMIVLHVDGAGPFGDPYQINSANNGPYGDALTQELIPYIEREFRGNGKRVLDGGSTGGWVSLALQIFYPDFFSGAWSACADGVDFRGFQLIDIYKDANAYVNAFGFERPAARDLDGDVKYSMRHECGRLENVLGRGDNWTRSGGQWGAWNAAYGPRGSDRMPVALWDPVTGAIDHSVAEQWKKYDLRLYVESNWKTLAPHLNGKLNIWMGDADDYFLNNAMRLFEEMTKRLEPKADFRIVFAPGKGHCWRGISEADMMKEMARAVTK